MRKGEENGQEVGEDNVDWANYKAADTIKAKDVDIGMLFVNRKVKPHHQE